MAKRADDLDTKRLSNGAVLLDRRPEKPSPFIDGKLDIAALSPYKFLPNGDRYVVEFVDVSDVTEGGLVLPDNAEKGWKCAVIIAVGHGHRLEVPDHAVTVRTGYIVDEALTPAEKQERMKQLGQPPPGVEMIDTQTGEAIVRPLARVPMFFGQGNVVLVEKYAGREIVFHGRRYAVVNQVDILCLCHGLQLKLNDKLEWEAA